MSAAARHSPAPACNKHYRPLLPFLFWALQGCSSPPPPFPSNFHCPLSYPAIIHPSHLSIMPFSAKKDNLLQVPSFAPHIAGALYGALARTASPALRHLPSSTARKPSHRQAIFIGLDLSTTPTDQPDAEEGLVDLTWSLVRCNPFVPSSLSLAAADPGIPSCRKC